MQSGLVKDFSSIGSCCTDQVARAPLQSDNSVHILLGPLSVEDLYLGDLVI